MRFRAIKGVQDILSPDIFLWQKVETAAHQVFSAFGYREIRPPIMEFTEVFSRSIGETTDIVEKEMYTFNDRAGRSITLRPEGTASVVRAYVQKHLYNLPAPQKYYCIGPMFRYERPQKGRFRQFHQIDVEAFGEDAPQIDAELLDMLRRFFESIGVNNLTFEVNSIGCDKCRPDYRGALKDFLSLEIDSLCDDCKRRYKTTPLRVLDCKVESCKNIIQGAPKVNDFLCQECREHFQLFQRNLKLLDIPHKVNFQIVRGLDYYTKTTFEVASDSLGAQNAVAGGGRYDKLVEEFGGPYTPAVGFAIGMERLITLLRSQQSVEEPIPTVFFATLGIEAERVALKLSSALRAKGIWVELDYRGASLRSQLRMADKLKALYVFIIGEDELSKGIVRYKRLSDGKQGEINKEDIFKFFSPFR